MTLLSEIMARLHGIDMPVVQFIRASGEAATAEIAARFAQASAGCLGRTLLIRLHASEPPGVSSSDEIAAVATIPRRRARKAADNLEIVPDSLIPGLCHARMGFAYGQASSPAQVSPDTFLEGVSLDFRVIVIESDAPERCPMTLDLALRCHGSVLVVAAGSTGLLQARRVMRQVQLVGGPLLGAVLHGAPSAPRFRVPGWLRRRPPANSAG